VILSTPCVSRARASAPRFCGGTYTVRDGEPESGGFEVFHALVAGAEQQGHAQSKASGSKGP